MTGRPWLGMTHSNGAAPWLTCKLEADNPQPPPLAVLAHPGARSVNPRSDILRCEQRRRHRCRHAMVEQRRDDVITCKQETEESL